MRQKLTKVAVVFSLVLAIGGQWGILQSIAWIGMAVSYSQDSALTEAISKTFDGNHPCQLCKVVQEGKKSERKQASLKVDTKLEFLPVGAFPLLHAPLLFVVRSDQTDSMRSRVESPPIPPPRRA